jgi:hypothetical protein
MLIIAIGPPSPVTQWGVHVLRSVLEKSVGPFEIVAQNRHRDLWQVWSPDREGNFLLLFDNPDSAIIASLPAAPVVAFIEDPAEVVTYSVRARNLPWQDCLRLTSLVFSSLHELYLKPDTLLIKRSSELRTEDVVADICRHLAIPIPEGFAGSFEDDLVRNLPFTEGNQFESREVAIETVCSAYRALLCREPMDLMHWPRELFFGKPPLSPEWQRIPLTGPARFLFHGPYLHLPPGRWRASLEFGVARNRSGNSLTLDIFCGELLARGQAALPQEGQFNVSLDFAVTEPVAPLECRARLNEGAIHGLLRIGSVTMTRVPHGPDNIMTKTM